MTERGDCEACDGTGSLVPGAGKNCRICGGTGTRNTRSYPRTNAKVIALEVAPDAYGVMKFKVGERDAALVLPVGLTKPEQEDALREIEELLEVVRGFHPA